MFLFALFTVLMFLTSCQKDIEIEPKVESKLYQSNIEYTTSFFVITIPLKAYVKIVLINGELIITGDKNCEYSMTVANNLRPFATDVKTYRELEKKSTNCPY